MTIDSDEAIKRMEKLIDEYTKYGYMEEAMYRMAVGHCIDIIRQMAGEHDDDARRVHSIHGKRVLRAKKARQVLKYLQELKERREREENEIQSWR